MSTTYACCGAVEGYLHRPGCRASSMGSSPPAPDRPPKTRERVAQCEEAITQLQRRLESLEARSPGTYTPDDDLIEVAKRHDEISRRIESFGHAYASRPENYPPGYPYPFGGTTDEED